MSASYRNLGDSSYCLALICSSGTAADVVAVIEVEVVPGFVAIEIDDGVDAGVDCVVVVVVGTADVGLPPVFETVGFDEGLALGVAVGAAAAAVVVNGVDIFNGAVAGAVVGAVVVAGVEGIATVGVLFNPDNPPKFKPLPPPPVLRPPIPPIPVLVPVLGRFKPGI